MNIRKSPSNGLLDLTRRRFLRTLGVSIAVPALESFPRRVLAADGAT